MYKYNSVKVLFVGLKTMSTSVTAKHPAHCNRLFIVSPSKFPQCARITDKIKIKSLGAVFHLL